MIARTLAGLAGMLVCSGIVWAEPAAGGPDAAFATPNGTTPTSTSLLPGAQPQPLLMNALDATPVGHALDAANVRIFGHVEGSYTYNFDSPVVSDLNLGRVFDLKNDRVLLNQVDLNIERPVDLSRHQLDVGGRIEMLYGSDARFIHSNGLLDGQDFFHGPEDQFDLPQLYVDVAVPVANGLRIRGGKFLFFKQIDPNASVFYSHSFSFGSALPYTLTGVSGFYPIDDRLSVEAGISRGWDQTFRDNNGAIDAFGRVRFDVNDRTSLTLAAIVGPELNHDNGHYRGTVDFTASFAATDRLTLLLDAVFGTQARPGTGNASWFGTSGYAVYQLNEFLALAGRLEWYRDDAGFTTAVSQTLYEATVGLTITPFPGSIRQNIKLRPELRADYSNRRFFDGLSRHDQYTAAVDAIVNF